MTTAVKKQEIRITTSPDLRGVLSVLAKRDSVSLKKKITDLLNLAIDIEEDRELVRIASQRKQEKGAVYLTHEEFWK